MTNVNPSTGIRYGVIAGASLDDDLLNNLFTNGRDLSYEEALAQIRGEVSEEADGIEEQVCDDYPEMQDDDLMLRIEAVWVGMGYHGRSDYIDAEVEKRAEYIQIDEPHIEGEHDGVTYQITWLGGAPLVWILEGPTGLANRLCSPCVPNAADLDGGFVPEEQTDRESDGYFCYVVPREWLAESEVAA